MREEQRIERQLTRQDDVGIIPGTLLREIVSASEITLEINASIPKCAFKQHWARAGKECFCQTLKKWLQGWINKFVNHPVNTTSILLVVHPDFCLANYRGINKIKL